MQDQPTHKGIGPLDTDARKRVLAVAVQTEVDRGSRVERMTDFSVVLVRGHRIRHLLHFVLTLLTAGSWSLVWIGLIVVRRTRRVAISVDDYGHLLRRKV